MVFPHRPSTPRSTMKTFTTVFCLLPMAVGNSATRGTTYGPLRKTIMGSLICSIDHLLVVPLFYTFQDDLQALFRRMTWSVVGKGNSSTGTRFSRSVFASQDIIGSRLREASAKPSSPAKQGEGITSANIPILHLPIASQDRSDSTCSCRCRPSTLHPYRRLRTA